MEQSPRPSDDGQAPRQGAGLSSSAWAGIATLGAAAITGLVTLVTHVLPPSAGGQAQQPGQVAAASTTIDRADGDAAVGLGSPGSTTATTSVTVATATTTAPAPRSALLELLTGSWSGEAHSGTLTYRIALEITDACVERGACGTMTTNLLPCVANITLVGITDGPEFDFATGSFGPGSSGSCTLRPQGGDYFVLGDDVLTYQTGYDGSIGGTLRRVR